MSLTITRTPNQVEPAGNPIPYELTTNNWLVSAAIVQVFGFTIDVDAVNGDTVTITIGSLTFTMTCATVPDDSGYQFRPTAALLTLADLIADFTNNYYINRYFVVTGVVGAPTPHTLTFTQREAAEDMQIGFTWANTTPLGGNVVAVDAVYQQNFKAITEVHVQTDRTVAPVRNLVAEMDCAPIANALNFELQKAFEGLFDIDIPADAEEAAITNCPNMIKSYWLQTFEFFGATALPYNRIEVGSANNYKQVIKGGMRWNDWPSGLFLANYCTNAEVLCLTKQPRTKVVATDQPEWLYFYLDDDTSNIKVLVDVTFDNGSTAPLDSQYIAGTTTGKKIYRFAVGYGQLELAGMSSVLQVVSWQARVVNGAEVPITETFTYYLDYRNYEVETTLLFENYFGAMDTLRCTGQVVEGIEASAIDAIGVLDPAYAEADGNMTQWQNNSRDKLTIYTGHKTQDEIRWLRELVDSPSIYMIENGNWVRLWLNKEAFDEVTRTNQALNGFALEFKRANLNRI